MVLDGSDFSLSDVSFFWIGFNFVCFIGVNINFFLVICLGFYILVVINNDNGCLVEDIVCVLINEDVLEL